jgi:hypothetical protein
MSLNSVLNTLQFVLCHLGLPTYIRVVVISLFSCHSAYIYTPASFGRLFLVWHITGLFFDGLLDFLYPGETSAGVTYERRS